MVRIIQPKSRSSAEAFSEFFEWQKVTEFSNIGRHGRENTDTSIIFLVSLSMSVPQNTSGRLNYCCAAFIKEIQIQTETKGTHLFVKCQTLLQLRQTLNKRQTGMLKSQRTGSISELGLIIAKCFKKSSHSSFCLLCLFTLRDSFSCFQAN